MVAMKSCENALLTNDLICKPSFKQPNCNRRGFNVKESSDLHARIGIAANQENDCRTCDSVIGFGINGGRFGSVTCGNRCRLSCDAGDKDVKTFGYILVQ